MITTLLKAFFHLLYHSFAWAYDLVAWIVSFGRWQQWTYSVLPLLKGPCILELGSGPGHLMMRLQQDGMRSFALDESRQMVRQSAQRFKERFGFSPRLARALGQRLPFPDAAFDTLVATFPAPYIFEPETLAEMRRVMKVDGQVVILLAAWITGTTLLDRLLAWVFNITGESPRLDDERTGRMLQRFTEAGLQAEPRFINLRTSRLLVITAKPENRHHFVV